MKKLVITVAIIGLTVDAAKGNNGVSMKDRLLGGMDKLVEIKESKLAEQFYDLTAMNLSKKANFTVLAKDKVLRNADIKKFFDVWL